MLLCVKITHSIPLPFKKMSDYAYPNFLLFVHAFEHIISRDVACPKQPDAS